LYHKEELNDWYFSPTIVWVIKLRMRWMGHVAHMERDHWGDPGIDGMIILRWIFRKWDVGVWTGLSWLRIDRRQALANVVMNLWVP
jgi:hypothetical protein